MIFTQLNLTWAKYQLNSDNAHSKSRKKSISQPHKTGIWLRSAIRFSWELMVRWTTRRRSPSMEPLTDATQPKLTIKMEASSIIKSKAKVRRKSRRHLANSKLLRRRWARRRSKTWMKLSDLSLLSKRSLINNHFSIQAKLRHRTTKNQTLKPRLKNSYQGSTRSLQVAIIWFSNLQISLQWRLQLARSNQEEEVTL